MGIAEFLDAPDGAVLVAINGEVELVTTRHETPMRLMIERFPLGPVASVDAVMALLDLYGVRPPAVTPALPASRPPRTARRTLAAPVEEQFACPECGRMFPRRDNLRDHRRRIHKVARGDIACPHCGHLFSSAHGLAVHQARKHPEVSATHASVAPPPSPPVVAAMPTDPRGICDACGMPNRNHLACEECGRRIGKGHTVEAPARQHGGKVWCANCVEILRQQTAHSQAARV